ncbi:MAG TPA: glycosyltransferase family 4 protein [Candidatus Polarisedimenticolia bacterium]|nr:glycosyltransferase family 4 protein [Candidatus Polarisedimenticolia bacterium]
MVPLLILQTLPRSSAFSPNNALLTLAREVKRSPFSVTVAVPRRGLLTEALEKEGIPVVCVPGLKTYRRHDALWRFPVVALRLSELARRLSVKLLVSNHAELGPFAHAAARLNGLPWICFLRQADRPLRYYEKYRVAKADAVAAVSSAALGTYRDFLSQRGLPPNRMQVIHTGIIMPGPARDSGVEIDRSSARRADRPITIGTVGLRSVKRPELLLRLVSQVRRRNPGFRALFVGGALEEDLKRLRSLAQSMGLGDAVVFAGQQSSMEPWYGEMDVYAHTSLSEALPKAVLEAMAHSLPVVAFDVGGIPEAVVDGVTGFLCREKDEGAYASALERLISDPSLCRKMGNAGAARIQESFSPAAMADGMFMLFEEILKNRRHEGWALGRRKA